MACAGQGQKAVDTDVRAGKFAVHLKWGRNMQRIMNLDGTGKMLAARFDYWSVLMVDKYGTSFGELGQVPTNKTESHVCCDPNQYQITVSGSWAKSATVIKFMIVPVVYLPGHTVASPKIYSLPMGIMTADFVDSTAGSSTIHKGGLVLKVAGAKEFLASPHAKTIMTESIAESTGVDQKNVFVTYLAGAANTGGRRLTHFGANGRRLAEGEIHVEYEVIFSGTDEGASKDFTAASFDQAKLKSAVTAKAKASGLANFEVTSLTVSPVTTSKVAGETTVTGGASPVAALSKLIVAAMMLTGLRFCF